MSTAWETVTELSTHGQRIGPSFYRFPPDMKTMSINAAKVPSTVLGIPLQQSAESEAPRIAIPSVLKESFATLFQIPDAAAKGAASLDKAAAEALAERIIQAIVQPSPADDFTEILASAPLLRVANNAAAGIKKGRTLAAAPAALKRTVTVLPLERKPIGQGSYGTIYKAQLSGEEKVLKEIRIEELDPNRNELLRGAMTELLIQHILAADPTHGNAVAKPYNVFMDLSFPTYKIYIYMEQVPQTFKEYMLTRPTTPQLQTFFVKVANILKHFRDTYQFYHCDFHIGNIMMNGAEPVIIDFGFSSLAYPGLPRIYGRYVGEAAVNDMLIFTVAFISRYSAECNPAFIAMLRGLLKAEHMIDPKFNLADAYATAEREIMFGEQIFHRFYYFKPLGNPVVYKYPLLDYDKIIANVGRWTAPAAAPAAAAKPVIIAEPVSVGVNIMPYLPRAAPGDSVGEKRSVRLSVAAGKANASSSFQFAQRVPTWLSPIAEASELPSRLSGTKRLRNKIGGTRRAKRSRQLKRRPRKTHKRPSRK